MFLLSNHYRSPIDYSEESMRDVNLGLDRIYAFLERLEKAGAMDDPSQKGSLWDEFTLAMNDDFNSAKAVACVFEAVKRGNRLLDETPNENTLKELIVVYNDIKAVSDILGIFMLEPSVYFKAKKEKGMADQAIDPSRINALIQERVDARKNKDFARADEIRDQLLGDNIVLKDGPEGTTWQFE
jgi:cysteinyl-tRNA synthetase